MILVLSLLIAIAASHATDVPCSQRLDVISLNDWPLLSTCFDQDLLVAAELAAVQERTGKHIAVLHSNCRTYLGGNSSEYHRNGSSTSTTRELGELRGHVVQDVKFGPDFAAILTADGTLWTAGRGWYAQLGHHGTQNIPAFYPVEGLPSVQAVALGDYHSVVLTRNGTLYSWGGNFNHALGYSTDTYVNPSPDRIPLHHAYSPSSVCCGSWQCVVLMDDSSVLTWGYMDVTGRRGYEAPPAAVLGIPIGQTITKIACGRHHSLALSSSGRLYGWGENGNGQLLNLPNYGLARELNVGDNRVLDVAAGPDITVIRTDAGMKYFGWYDGTSSSTPQTTGSFETARDIMAKSYQWSFVPIQDTYGSVQLGCSSVRRERCEEGSNDK